MKIIRKSILNLTAGALLMAAPVLFLLSCKKSDKKPAAAITTGTDGDTSQNTTDTTAYQLVWSDEFNGTSVDQSKWNFETGNLNVNHEEEYYQPQNATVANGNLVITAKNETVGGFPYTSARMNTKGKFAVAYGKIEARIKLPTGAGLWPAFWMLGVNIDTVSWPACGEIDIMEHINTDSLIYGTMHWSVAGQQASYGENLDSSPAGYHVYSVVWDSNSIKWYVDDKLYVTGNIANDINSTDAFHKPFFIILNLAVGGDWPGQYVDTARLPASMYVDYVRVYQAKK